MCTSVNTSGDGGAAAVGLPEIEHARRRVARRAACAGDVTMNTASAEHEAHHQSRDEAVHHETSQLAPLAAQEPAAVAAIDVCHVPLTCFASEAGGLGGARRERPPAARPRWSALRAGNAAGGGSGKRQRGEEMWQTRGSTVAHDERRTDAKAAAVYSPQAVRCLIPDLRHPHAPHRHRRGRTRHPRQLRRRAAPSRLRGGRRTRTGPRRWPRSARGCPTSRWSTSGSATRSTAASR